MMRGSLALLSGAPVSAPGAGAGNAAIVLSPFRAGRQEPSGQGAPPTSRWAGGSHWPGRRSALQQRGLRRQGAGRQRSPSPGSAVRRMHLQPAAPRHRAWGQPAAAVAAAPAAAASGGSTPRRRPALPAPPQQASCSSFRNAWTCALLENIRQRSDNPEGPP